MSGAASGRARVLFLYWGRRGAISRLSIDVMRAAMRSGQIEPLLSISRQTENFADFAEFGEALVPVDTFSSSAGALTGIWRLPALRRQIADLVRDRKIDAVVTLMPHVWTPLVIPAIRRAGARYVTIMHDAVSHPGDLTALVLAWLRRDLRQADRVVALSDAVATALLASGEVARDRLSMIALPDLDYGVRAAPRPPAEGEPWRLLFIGRIMRYKGLSLCIDAVQMLRERGVNVTLGVYGEGALGGDSARLQAMGADVVNRWLSEAEIARALASHHAVVLTHVEASQSGVATTAFAAGLPVIATPVGGLVEQVRTGETGVLAASTEPAAVATAIETLIGDPGFYRAVCAKLVEGAGRRSADRFVADLALSLFP